MDVKGSEWNDEQLVVRMWLGYMWRVQVVGVTMATNNKHGTGIYYCNITCMCI